MRLSLDRPEIVRGDPWYPGPPPAVSPDWLAFGHTRLRLKSPAAGLPRGATGVYLGHSAGRVALGLAGPCGLRVALVPADQLDEPEPLGGNCDLDFEEFREGYELGAWEALSERPVGSKASGGTPTWFGLGVVAGHRARLSGRTGWDDDKAAYNAYYRERAARSLASAALARGTA